MVSETDSRILPYVTNMSTVGVIKSVHEDSTKQLRLTWRKHITTKKKQLDLKLGKLYWITGRKSQLLQENKLSVYKAILKPIWTYGVHSCQQKSIGLKFSKSKTGSNVRYSCNHNSSRFTFPIFAHSCRFSVLHSLQSITPRIY